MLEVTVTKTRVAVEASGTSLVGKDVARVRCWREEEEDDDDEEALGDSKPYFLHVATNDKPTTRTIFNHKDRWLARFYSHIWTWTAGWRSWTFVFLAVLSVLTPLNWRVLSSRMSRSILDQVRVM